MAIKTEAKMKKIYLCKHFGNEVGIVWCDCADFCLKQTSKNGNNHDRDKEATKAKEE